MKLRDRVGFITGASSGIGRAAAVAMAREGAHVALVGRSKDGLNETAHLVEAEGRSALPIVADVADQQGIRAAVDATIKRFGKLDCAFNNAGALEVPTNFTEYDMKDFMKVFDVNVFGMVYCMQAQIEVMLRQGGGAIVNTGSGACRVGFPQYAAYTSSKHAMAGLTKAVAKEYASRNIRINSVCPGYIYTPMLAPVIADKAIEDAAIAAHPIGRLGNPEEVAAAAVWLCSDEAAFVVGVNMQVDGGMTA